MANLAMVEATEFTDNGLFAFRSKVRAYRADERDTTHPIEMPIPDTDAAFANFDAITYSKGSATLNQLRHLVGPEAFRQGVSTYLKTHAYANTAVEDFLNAISAAAERDLTGWSTDWLHRPGTNGVSVDFACAAGVIGEHGRRAGGAERMADVANPSDPAWSVRLRRGRRDRARPAGAVCRRTQSRAGGSRDAVSRVRLRQSRRLGLRASGARRERLGTAWSPPSRLRRLAHPSHALAGRVRDGARSTAGASELHRLHARQTSNPRLSTRSLRRRSARSKVRGPITVCLPTRNGLTPSPPRLRVTCGRPSNPPRPAATGKSCCSTITSQRQRARPASTAWPGFWTRQVLLSVSYSIRIGVGPCCGNWRRTATTVWMTCFVRSANATPRTKAGAAPYRWWPRSPIPRNSASSWPNCSIPRARN